MRPWIAFLKLLISILITASSALASQFPEDALSITPQDGHMIFNDSIDNAKSSIEMIMFRLTDQESVNHLIAAHNRGVNVRIIVDHQGTARGAAKVMFDQLIAAGVDIRLSTESFTISHAKSAVFDKQWTLITSMNLTRVVAITRDYGIRTYDPEIIAEYEAVFESDWLNAVNQTGNTPKLTNQKLAWSPVNAKEKILNFIKSAKKSVYIEVENLGDNEVIATLKATAQRGIKTTVIVPACVEGSGTRNVPFIQNLASSGVDARLSMPPYTTQNPYIHAKTIVVDDENFYVGSENLSYNSLTKARELGIIEYNPSISSVIMQAINYDIKLSIHSNQYDVSFACPDSKY